MILTLLTQNFVQGLIFILAILLAISVHESAHAWLANQLGDPTAKQQGRVSLNPIDHLETMGVIFFLLVGFGWGKPVPVDENRLHHRYDIIAVALAGPASNLILATLLSLVYRFVAIAALQNVLVWFIAINLSLMLFNLIPIPPLDGSKLWRLVMSPTTYYQLERNSLFLILAIFLLVEFTPLGTGLGGGVNAIFHLLTGASVSIF